MRTGTTGHGKFREHDYRGNIFSVILFHYRYASLYFCCAIEDQDNELITLEIIHRYVELLDKYFGSVSSSRLVFILSLISLLFGDSNCEERQD